jgi:hypothetical protein
MANQIDSPLNNATVGPNFQASGEYPGGLKVLGKMMQGEATITTGTTTQQPQGKTGAWIIAFTAVPVGSGYTLVVTNPDGGDVAQAGNLTVST